MSRLAPVTYLLLLLCASCTDTPTQVRDSVRVDLNKSEFGVNEEIVVAIINASGEDAFFSHCGFRVPIIVERREGSEWTEVFGINGPACPADRPSGVLVLQPDDHQIQSVSIQSTGEFRLRLEFGGEFIRILYVRYSEPFIVKDGAA